MSQTTVAIAIFDIDGVVRDVGGSYRRALADTVEAFTQGAYRPSVEEIDQLKAEGIWNNDWEASRELVYRYYESQRIPRESQTLDYQAVVAFFQSRYRGPDPDHWTGYICQEPLLMQASYLEQLTEAGIGWGFFSGATRGSATYVLEKRLGLRSPILVAMEDAPGKPDPTGLLATLEQLDSTQTSANSPLPALYIGDTVADMRTVQNVRKLHPDRRWIGIGILPPHAQSPAEYAENYAAKLTEAGADRVLKNVMELNTTLIRELIDTAIL